MFPGLDFHVHLLVDRVNDRLHKDSMYSMDERLVWNDLGVVHIDIPSCLGDITVSLESITIEAFMVAKPITQDPFSWLYTDLDKLQSHWSNLIECVSDKTFLVDAHTVFMRFTRPCPSFTVGLNNGSYLKIETRSARLGIWFDLFKGTKEDLPPLEESNRKVGLVELFEDRCLSTDHVTEADLSREPKTRRIKTQSKHQDKLPTHRKSSSAPETIHSKTQSKSRMTIVQDAKPPKTQSTQKRQRRRRTRQTRQAATSLSDVKSDLRVSQQVKEKSIEQSQALVELIATSK